MFAQCLRRGQLADDIDLRICVPWVAGIDYAEAFTTGRHPDSVNERWASSRGSTQSRFFKSKLIFAAVSIGVDGISMAQRTTESVESDRLQATPA